MLEDEFKRRAPDAIRRAVRTFVQAAVAMIVLQAGALALDAEDGVIDVDLWRRVIITAIVSGAIAVATWVQNALEDRTGKAILK